jgi:hypothetical protein
MWLLSKYGRVRIAPLTSIRIIFNYHGIPTHKKLGTLQIIRSILLLQS